MSDDAIREKFQNLGTGSYSRDTGRPSGRPSNRKSVYFDEPSRARSDTALPSTQAWRMERMQRRIDDQADELDEWQRDLDSRTRSHDTHVESLMNELDRLHHEAEKSHRIAKSETRDAYQAGRVQAEYERYTQEQDALERSREDERHQAREDDMQRLMHTSLQGDRREDGDPAIAAQPGEAGLRDEPGAAPTTLETPHHTVDRQPYDTQGPRTDGQKAAISYTMAGRHKPLSFYGRERDRLNGLETSRHEIGVDRERSRVSVHERQGNSSVQTRPRGGSSPGSPGRDLEGERSRATQQDLSRSHHSTHDDQVMHNSQGAGVGERDNVRQGTTGMVTSTPRMPDRVARDNNRGQHPPPPTPALPLAPADSEVKRTASHGRRRADSYSTCDDSTMDEDEDDQPGIAEAIKAVVATQRQLRADWDIERTAMSQHIGVLEAKDRVREREVQELRERSLGSASAGPPVRGAPPGSVYNAPLNVPPPAPIVTPVPTGSYVNRPPVVPQSHPPLIPMSPSVATDLSFQTSLPNASYVEGAALDPRGPVYNAVFLAGETRSEWGKERVSQAESEYYAVGPFDIYSDNKEEKLKVSIDPFKGTSKDNPCQLISFLRHMEEAAYGARWGYVRKGRELRMRLVSDAADQVHGLDRVSGHDYNTLVNTLYTAYIPAVIQTKAQYELLNLKEGDDTPQEQGRKVRDLCLVAYPPHVVGNTDQQRSSQALTHFLRSIPAGPIRSYVSISSPKTLQEAVNTTDYAKLMNVPPTAVAHDDAVVAAAGVQPQASGSGGNNQRGSGGQRNSRKSRQQGRGRGRQSSYEGADGTLAAKIDMSELVRELIKQLPSASRSPSSQSSRQSSRQQQGGRRAFQPGAPCTARCFRCQKVGHLIRDCRQRPSDAKCAIAGSAAMVDGVCTDHVCACMQCHWDDDDESDQGDGASVH